MEFEEDLCGWETRKYDFQQAHKLEDDDLEICGLSTAKRFPTSFGQTTKLKIKKKKKHLSPESHTNIKLKKVYFLNHLNTKQKKVKSSCDKNFHLHNFNLREILNKSSSKNFDSTKMEIRNSVRAKIRKTFQEQQKNQEEFSEIKENLKLHIVTYPKTNQRNLSKEWGFPKCLPQREIGISPLQRNKYRIQKQLFRTHRKFVN